MARRGRRNSGKKLKPPMPEAKEELHLPKYFGIIRGGSYNKAIEERREIIPGPMPGADETPRAISGRRPLLQPSPFPAPAPEPERVPLLIRAARYFAEMLGVEPERPVAMPKVPELNFPALYTRFPIMKTVTKTTDANGEITVTYAQSYATIPGVVITVKDPDNVFGTVFSTTLTGFEVRLFKMDHNHGGVVDDDGKHTPTINADGNHAHDVTGSLSWTENSKYGRLVLANYTDYETDHVHTQVQTQLESDHVHGMYPTSEAGSHGHSVPTTGGCASNYTAVSSIYYGSDCEDGKCVTNAYTHSYANSGHSHAVGSTGGGGSHTHPNISTKATSHRHILNSTDAAPSPGHRHLISNDSLYEHYMTSISNVNLSLLVTAQESPYHAHSSNEIAVHGHGVANDGRVLLKSTNVTITYIAQEESS